VLAVDITAEIVAPFEQPEDGLPLPDGMEPYRAFVVPAEIVNRYPIIDVSAGQSAGQSTPR
jgi:hypothetical protein